MQPNGATASSWRQITGWVRSLLSLTFVATLLGLGLSNIALRATWNEVEDGILWVTGPDGVTAADVAPDGPGTESGLRAGDVLLAIDGRPIQRPADVVATLHAGQNGTRLNYTVVRLCAR
jgi:S1-C subfamily serine protease